MHCRGLPHPLYKGNRASNDSQKVGTTRYHRQKGRAKAASEFQYNHKVMEDFEGLLKSCVRLLQISAAVVTGGKHTCMHA